MNVIINQMAVLFSIMAVGFIVGKLKMLTPESNKLLTRLVLFIALPCTILNSVFENEMDITIGDTLYFLLMTMLTFAIAFAVSIPVIYLLRGKKRDRGLFNFLSVFSNCGFMGFPVVIAIMGVSSAYYVALFNIPFNVLVFSLGIFMVSSGKTDEDGKQSAFNPKSLINPVLIAALIAIPIALFGIRPPQILADAFKITGAITTPGGMLVIGSTLAYVPLKTLLSEWRIIPVTILKLLVIPLLTWLILRQLITSELLLGVLVIISAMPSAAMASMLAIEYGGNEKAASAGVFLSTLLCGITVPLAVYLLL
ncbi:MAG: AEC family transporter [Oscillospiraceae bacterium]|nr:AEC family transporter [Oscillospiraceae bacterium]